MSSSNSSSKSVSTPERNIKHQTGKKVFHLDKGDVSLPIWRRSNNACMYGDFEGFPYYNNAASVPYAFHNIIMHFHMGPSLNAGMSEN